MKSKLKLIIKFLFELNKKLEPYGKAAAEAIKR